MDANSISTILQYDNVTTRNGMACESGLCRFLCGDLEES